MLNKNSDGVDAEKCDTAADTISPPIIHSVTTFIPFLTKKSRISKAFDKPPTRDILIQTTSAERSRTIFLAIVKSVTSSSSFIRRFVFSRTLMQSS